MILTQKISEPQRAILKSTASLNLFLAGVGCFHKDTLVATASGHKRICDIQIGDYVLSFDTKNQVTGYKQVVNKYKYKTGQIKQNCIIFELFNNNQIICTDGHEFYINGTWHTAGSIAERVMEAGSEYGGTILYKQYGPVTDKESLRREQTCNNETCNRWIGLSEDCDIKKRECLFTNDKTSQTCCGCVHSESIEQKRSQSYKRDQDRQYCYESGMGNSFRELYSCFQDRTGIKQGIETSKAQIDRGNSLLYADIKKRREVIQGDFSNNGLQEGSNKRLLYEKLVAREVSLNEIKSVHSYDCDYVYDLEVVDNHNYCITDDNIIVHNSGKTHVGGIISYRFIKKFPKCRGFIGANTYLQLTQSTLFRMREYWKSIGVTEYDRTSNPHGLYVVNKKPPAHFDTAGHNFDDYYGIISFINGCVVFTGSLDHAEAHYGKEFAWAILDETKDSDETDIKEVILSRLRQRGIYVKDGELSTEGTDLNPAYFLTSPAKTDWINELFRLEDFVDEIAATIYSDKTFFHKHFENKFVTISSTYHNLHNLPSNYIDNLRERNTEERFKALVYGNPFSQTGGEFYSSFSRTDNVGNVKYDPALPIHISFDQNSVPYNSAGLMQIKRIDEKWNGFDWYWEWRFFDEIALQNPRNSTEEVCEEFIQRYDRYKPIVYYYGDASGHSRKVSAAKTDFQHHYEVVEYKLSKYLVNGSDRTLFVNPSIPLRRDFINKIFEGKLPIKFIVDEECHKMIADLMYTKQAIDGTKDKHITEDKETGDKYQKYGHFGDLLDYTAVELFKDYYNG